MVSQKSTGQFAAVVSETAGVKQSGEERRRLLLEYRERVEKAHKEQEARLATLEQARQRIEKELAGLDNKQPPRQTVETLEKERKEQTAALEKEAQARAEVVAERRKQVEQIQKKVAQPSEARRSPRLDIHAVVRFGKKPDDVIMRARNISMTGALLTIEPDLVTKFAIETEHDAFVFLSADPKGGIDLKARVVRQEKNAIAVDWSNDVEASFRIALLISTLPPEEQ